MDPFVDIIYIVVVVPTLLYLGLKRNKAPRELFKFALLLAVLTLIYHLSNLINIREDPSGEEEEYTRHQVHPIGPCTRISTTYSHIPIPWLFTYTYEKNSGKESLVRGVLDLPNEYATSCHQRQGEEDNYTKCPRSPGIRG